MLRYPPLYSISSMLKRITGKSQTKPLRFDNKSFETLPASEKFEEESLDDFSQGRYYPIRIGEVLDTKYQVVGKLGYGLGSTVWLARDLKSQNTVAVKVFTNDAQNKEETNIYRHLSSIKSRSNHVGRGYIRDALDTFTLLGPKAEHQCLVFKPMLETTQELLRRGQSGRFTEPLLKALILRVLLALDYLHTEAHLVHTDISSHNILLGIEDKGILDSFIEAEQDHPSPRKVVNGYTVYLSRSFSTPKGVGEPVLSDFGSAVSGEVEHTQDVQPNVYRSPEICLQMPWGYKIDIWNVGVMIWDLFEGKHMFNGKDHIEQRYLTRAHLSEMIALLGPPPVEFLKRGKRCTEFFTEDGHWRGAIPIPKATTLEESEENLSGGNKEAFLQFIRKMVQWRPEDRQTANKLLQDPWLTSD